MRDSKYFLLTFATLASGFAAMFFSGLLKSKREGEKKRRDKLKGFIKRKGKKGQGRRQPFDMLHGDSDSLYT